MELLSPAGSLDCLKAAIKSGADAVYCGGVNFSARRNAKNFTREELDEAIRLCHLHQAKIYVAVNILIKEAEFYDALCYAKELIESGVDGIIVQDLGLLSAIRKMSSEIFINASTQMTIGSKDAVRFAKELGADRVVLARELGLSEIKSIAKDADCELETFVHGALCMSWSGQCLLSSVIGGRSGNRGLCAQPCRLCYTLLKNGKPVSKNMPLLSPKDICLAKRLKELSPFVDSLKIEGRMKSAEYTASACALYKKAMRGTITEREIEKTLSFFSRGGSSEGYFKGRQFDKMMDYTPGIKASATRTDLVQIKEENLVTLRPVSFVLTAKAGEKISLTAQACGFSATAFGDVCEVAQKEFDEERADAQLRKLGDTAFFAQDIQIIHEKNPFVPVSQVNALRRDVCAQLEDLICASYKKQVISIPQYKKQKKADAVPRLLVEVSTKEQYACAKELGCDILVSYELSKQLAHDFVLCPAVKKEGDEENLSCEKIMAQNIGQLDFSRTVYGGERLNVTNSVTCQLLKEKGVKRVTLSPELNIKEIREITDNTSIPTEIIVYGRLPVMVMENCVIKSQGMCRKGGKDTFELLDRLGERFPIVCENCRNILLNSVPIYMADKPGDLLSLNADVWRLKFTTETKEEVAKVVAAYKVCLEGKASPGVFKKITRGHFYRGAE